MFLQVLFHSPCRFLEAAGSTDPSAVSSLRSESGRNPSSVAFACQSDPNQVGIVFFSALVVVNPCKIDRIAPFWTDVSSGVQASRLAAVEAERNTRAQHSNEPLWVVHTERTATSQRQLLLFGSGCCCRADPIASSAWSARRHPSHLCGMRDHLLE